MGTHAYCVLSFLVITLNLDALWPNTVEGRKSGLVRNVDSDLNAVEGRKSGLVRNVDSDLINDLAPKTSHVNNLAEALTRKVIFRVPYDLDQENSIESDLDEFMVKQVISQDLKRCRLVLLGSVKAFSSKLVRWISEATDGVLLVRPESLNEAISEDGPLFERLWNDDFITCRAFVVHLASLETDSVFSFMKASGLEIHPDIIVVFIGSKGREQILLNPVLRNTKYAFYLSSETALDPSSDQAGSFNIYWLCLHCEGGQPVVKHFKNMNVKSPLNSRITDTGADQSLLYFPDQFRNFHNYTLKVVSLPYFPFTDFAKAEEQEGVNGHQEGDGFIRKDSLDIRMANVISQDLNFTYAIQEPAVRQWGALLPDNKTFQGIVGDLQSQKADMSFLMTPTSSRLRAVDHTTYYSREGFVILSSKPKLLPHHLALVRPFTFDVWLALLFSSGLFAMTMWTLQKIQSHTIGGSSIPMSLAFLFSWSTLLETPYDLTSAKGIGKILVGWWPIMCMVITYAYKSSLIAHLIVQGRNKPIDTFEGLETANGWTWGAEPFFFGASAEEFFDGTITLKMMEKHNLEEAVDRILQENHALITWDQYIKSIISSRFTNAFGVTPFHLSRETKDMQYSWAFRKGAPFAKAINDKMQRLIETGHTEHWLNEVIKNVEKVNQASDQAWMSLDKVTDGTVVLTLGHIQGAFYILGMGFTGALVVLLFEIVSC